MTRKDYELIAEAIKSQVDDAYWIREYNNSQVKIGNKVDRTEEDTMFRTLAQLVGYMGQSLQSENSRFNKTRFEEACGFTPER